MCLKIKKKQKQTDSNWCLTDMLSPQEILALIWSPSEGWKAESALEPPCDFEPGTPGSGIQHPNYQAIAS